MSFQRKYAHVANTPKLGGIAESLAELKPDNPYAPRLFLSRIVNSSFLSDAEKGVYIGLCHHVSRSTRSADVSVATLAADLGLDPLAVKRSLRRLERLKVIRSVVRIGRNTIYYPIWR